MQQDLTKMQELLKLQESFYSLLQGDLDIRTNAYLAHAIGMDAAITLNALLVKQAYYIKHGMLDDDGFFYSTVDDLWAITTFSKFVQTSALKSLEEKGLLIIKVKGLPAKRHFKINYDAVILGNLILKGKAIMTKPAAEAAEAAEAARQKGKKDE
jgi:hypothetical protein